MQNKIIIESFDTVGKLFDEVHLALEDCVRAGRRREQESRQGFAKLERAMAQLTAAVRAAGGAVCEFHGRLDRLEQALRAEMDQLRRAAERRFAPLESSMNRFQLELKRHREEFRLLSDDVAVLKSDVKILKDDVKILKSDVKILKDDVKILKDDVKVLRSDHEALSVAVQELRLEMCSEFARLESKMDAGFAELKREMGNLGNSIGAFVEDLSIPSLRRIITSLHDVDFVAPFVFFDADTGRRELDAFAVTRPDAGAGMPREAFVFEIKRKFSNKDIEQIRNNIFALRKAMSQFRKCPIYAYLLAASISEAQKRKVWDAGIHLVTYGDKLFDLPVPPANFEFDYEIGIPKRPSGRGHPQRAVPRPPPPFYLQQLKRIRDSIKAGQQLH